MQKQVDWQNSEILRTLPNGDTVRVRPQYMIDDALKRLPRLEAMRPRGQHRCTHCGQDFVSDAVLQRHVEMRHRVASGQAAVQAVELPDGSSVPLELVLREWQELKRTKALPVEQPVTPEDLIQDSVRSASRKRN